MELPISLRAVFVAAALFATGCDGSAGSGTPATLDAALHRAETAPRATATNPAPTVTVDFAKPTHVRSQAGFLHGYQTNIADALLTPLQPALWRFDLPFENPGYVKVRRLFPGLQIVDVLSDDYGYPFAGNWNSNGNPNPPYDRAPYAGKGVPAWSATVASVVQEYHNHPDVLYEEWNEPNVSSQYLFFYGTEQQADATQDIAYASAIKNDAAAVIGGPATAGYDKTFIVDYLNYCLANGCQVNFVSLHEFDDSNISGVASDVADLRQTIAATQYAPLHIAHIFVDEAIGPTSDRRPGDILGYLYYLEAGGSDGAAKACWSEPSNASECGDGSLDGIVDPATSQPRAAWWAYKSYAAGVSERVWAQTVDPRIIALASSMSPSASAPPTAQVLLGAFDENGPPSTSTPAVQLQHVSALKFLTGRKTVHVVVTAIPATDASPLPSLPKPVEQTVPINEDTAVFTVSLPDHTGAIVSLSATAP